MHGSLFVSYIKFSYFSDKVKYVVYILFYRIVNIFINFLDILFWNFFKIMFLKQTY